MLNIDNKNNTAEEAAKYDSSSAELSYIGKINIQFCDGNKILKRRTYYNNGCGPLFKFVAHCLQGDYSQAEKIRPNKIKLFSNNSTEVKLDWTKTKSVSGFVTSNAPADIDVIKDDNKNIIGYKAILHFLVPAAFVDSKNIQEEDTNAQVKKGSGINQIGLYSTKETDDKKPSAYFLFKKTENEVDIWDGLQTDDLSENINILIDWEMSIKNGGGN